MKILHITKLLPDCRVERNAQLLKDLGFDNYVLLAQPGDQSLGEADLFKKIYQLPLSAMHALGLRSILGKKIRREAKEIISELDPDVIHAHDILYAQFIETLNIDVPMIYDSHEFWSEIAPYNFPLNLKNPYGLLRNALIRNRMPKWEKKLLKKHPVITVSHGIADSFTKNGAERLVVIPNFPHSVELDKIKLHDKNEELTAAYLGSDFGIDPLAPYRDTRILEEIYSNGYDIGNLMVVGKYESESDQIHSTGQISHIDCYEELSRVHVGFQGFQSHEYLQYVNPNKVHMYAHAGNVLVIPKIMIRSMPYLSGISIGYKCVSKVSGIMKSLKLNVPLPDPEDIREHALGSMVLNPFIEEMETVYEWVN